MNQSPYNNSTVNQSPWLPTPTGMWSNMDCARLSFIGPTSASVKFVRTSLRAMTVNACFLGGVHCLKTHVGWSSSAPNWKRMDVDVQNTYSAGTQVILFLQQNIKPSWLKEKKRKEKLRRQQNTPCINWEKRETLARRAVSLPHQSWLKL